MSIAVKNLTFSYGGEPVLDNVSFDVKDNDFVALIGPNGSGKTTIVKLLLAKLKTQKGDINIFGTPVNLFRDWHKIGYVPQRFNIDSQFPGTVQEILSVGQHNTLPSALGIHDLLNSKFSELSGGQQQKVLIAFALQSNPQLLILDEPTVGIDAKSEKEFYTMLKDLNTNHKVTIILITHDVGMIPKHFKRVICVNKTVCCQGPVSKTTELLKEAYGENFVVHQHH